MKLFAVIASLIVAATAQTISITSPPPGGSLRRGTNATITVQRPNTTTAVQDVSIVLSLDPCTGTTCPNPSEQLGTILFAGPFAPTGSTPTQSFTVAIPGTLPSGEAELLATHFALTGTGPAPFTQVVGQVILLI